MDMPQEKAYYPRPPGKEIMREVAVTKSDARFAVTQNALGDKFFLYAVAKDGALSKRLATARSPEDLIKQVYKEEK